MAKLIAKTYGDALFELAVEKHLVDEMASQIQAMAQVWKENPDFGEFLTHPQIEREEKQQVINNVFEGKVQEELLGFLHVVVEKGRQKELPAIFEYFEGQVKEYKHIGVVHVTTPMPLSEEKKKALVQKLTVSTEYETLEMHYELDESLIGGMVIRIKDRILDSSVKTRLEHMTRDLMKITIA